MTDKTKSLAAHDRGSDVIHAVSGGIHFATDLYSTLSAAQQGDIVFSPNSIMLALAMTFAGTNGETAEEIAEVLHFSIDPARLHEAFRLLQATTLANDVELRIANRLWGQKGYHFLPEFLSLTEQCYGAKIAELDFRNQSEDARRQINKWIEQQTSGRITDLIPPATLNSMTRLVLTNAVYFLGGWQDEFEKAATKLAPFWTKPDEEHSVQMMHQSERFRYGDFDDVQVLELPYRYREPETDVAASIGSSVDSPRFTSALVMTIILPRKIVGLVEIESALSPTNINRWTTLKSQQVNVAIPKFRIESGFGLADTLRSMGIRKAFSLEDADFSGMSDDPEGLFIGEVLHKAFIEVDEKGTEAAAATAAMAFAGCAIREETPKEFRADHPFLFLIRDRHTRLIHFMGRMTGSNLK